jgi:hypothetical protein
VNIVEATIAVGITIALLPVCVWVILDWFKVRDARRQAEEELERYRQAFGRKDARP